ASKIAFLIGSISFISTGGPEESIQAYNVVFASDAIRISALVALSTPYKTSVFSRVLCREVIKY
ncbi:MAG: hypothetical protein ACJ72U_00335, partial [Nitrososphaeraceae archaeon]